MKDPDLKALHSSEELLQALQAANRPLLLCLGSVQIVAALVWMALLLAPQLHEATTASGLCWKLGLVLAPTLAMQGLQMTLLRS